MKVIKYYRNFLTAILIAVYAFAVSPAEYLHHHFLHHFDQGNVQEYSLSKGEKVLRKAFSSCDTKCPICHHKLLSEERPGIGYTIGIISKQFIGKIPFFISFILPVGLFSLSGRGPPVLLCYPNK